MPKKELPILFTPEVCANPNKLAQALQLAMDHLTGETDSVREDLIVTDNRIKQADDRARVAADQDEFEGKVVDDIGLILGDDQSLWSLGVDLAHFYFSSQVDETISVDNTAWGRKYFVDGADTYSAAIDTPALVILLFVAGVRNNSGTALSLRTRLGIRHGGGLGAPGMQDMIGNRMPQWLASDNHARTVVNVTLHQHTQAMIDMHGEEVSFFYEYESDLAASNNLIVTDRKFLALYFKLPDDHLTAPELSWTENTIARKNYAKTDA